MIPRLRVYAIDSMRVGMRLKTPVLTAAPSMVSAAKILHVTVHHLTKHPLPLTALSQRDIDTAFANPGRIVQSRKNEKVQE